MIPKRLYGNLGKFDLALKDMSSAIEINPKVPEYWLRRSMAEYTLGKKEEAKADALKAVELGMQIDNSYLKELGL
jgi:tetratricopeptide (TPR) repeat protein